jgi:hypothetical protein
MVDKAPQAVKSRQLGWIIADVVLVIPSLWVGVIATVGNIGVAMTNVGHHWGNVAIGLVLSLICPLLLLGTWRWFVRRSPRWPLRILQLELVMLVSGFVPAIVVLV